MKRFASIALLSLFGCSSGPNTNIVIPDGAGTSQGPGVDSFVASNTDSGGNQGNLDGFNSGNPDSAGTVDAGKAPDSGTVTPTGSNQVQIVADGFPGGNNGVPDVGFITVTICAPGSTTNCQTIDHISIDTGSVGLHIMSSVINSSLLSALPQQKSSSKAVTECYIYEDGYVYGSVRTADLSIGGEKASSIPFMAISDPSYTKAPTGCTGSNDGASVDSFGGNGIIGIAPYSPDCGSSCTTASTDNNPIYYACSSGTSCTAVAMPTANQLPNPIAMFGTDNNGVIIDLPSISDSGALNPTGTLTFGVATQSDNAIASSAKVYQGEDQGGIITIDDTVKSTNKEAVMIFDSGTSVIAVTAKDATACTSASGYSGWYCPKSTVTESVTFSDGTTTGTQSFDIGDVSSLFPTFPTSATAFPDVGTPGEAASGQDAAFDIFGFPFFFGHTIYFVIEGATAGSVTGPAYAL